MNKKGLLLLALMSAGCLANAQTKIGGTIGAADPNAYLQLGDTASNKGLLLSRVNLTATNLPAPLTAHEAGMVVYNTVAAGTGITAVTPGYYYNDGTKWVRGGAGTGTANWYKAGTTAAAVNADSQYVTGNIGIGGHTGGNNDITYNFSVNNPNAPLVVVAPGNADTAVMTPATGMRLVMPGIYGYKWPLSADFQIGSYATGLAATSKMDIRLGNGGTATPDVTVASFLGNGNVGIGTTAPDAKLELAGQVKITGGTPGINKVLTSDANGLATWQPAATDGDAWGVDGENVLDPIKRTGIVRLGTATSGSIELVPGSATQSGHLDIYKGNGTTRLGYMGFDNNNLTYVSENAANHVFSGGKVGVGIATPDARLDVRGQLAAATGGLRVMHDNATVGIDMGWNGISASGTNLNHSLTLDSKGSSPVIINGTNTAGNVGIGLTDPQITIDVKNNGKIGTSQTVVSQHDAADRGIKLSVGAVVNNLPTEFTGMKIVSSAGTQGCGNSSDVTFNTWECNTSLSREVMRVNGTGNVGIGTATPAYKLHVNGNVGAYSYNCLSDQRLKHDIQDYKVSANKVLQVRPVTYILNADPNGQTEIGVVAQELEKLFPELVTTGGDGYKSVKYDRISILLLGVAQQQQHELAVLKNTFEKAQKDNTEKTAMFLQEIEKLKKQFTAQKN